LIHPIVCSKHLKADIQRLKLISPGSIFSFTLCLGVASTTLLSISLGSVMAQMPFVTHQMAERTVSQVNVLFVNPSVADDTTGNGSEGAPLKTITQALQVAAPNTVIMLSPGIYSAETGEVFPLALKPGVSIQGDTRTKGQGMTIQGGGGYLSRSFGGQNVTIIGANQAALTGVTVTNPNPRGYGLWIESSNPVITENTFTGSTQDGISIAGNSAPIISKNHFHRNGANGITIGGNSQPEVRENVFEQTGFGINVTQNATPIVVSNQIQQNRSGILVQAKARPILRNNLIQGSQEDGLVAIAQAMPDLGNAAEPGGNEFVNNTRYDINASAAKQMIFAFGNTLAKNRIAGQVDFNPQAAPIANNSIPNSVISEIPANGEITFAAPGVSSTNEPVDQGQLADTPQKPPTPRTAGFSVLSSLAAREDNQVASGGRVTALPDVRPNLPQLNYVRINPNTIEFVAPQLPPGGLNQEQSLPTAADPPFGESVLLPAPNGNTRNLQKAPVPPTHTARVQQGVRYRVVVNVATDRERDIVRTLAPGAFATIWQGRRVMQVGVFSDRRNADEMLKVLNSNGLKTIVEPLN
jgi:parallel beta-helix repeat protein